MARGWGGAWPIRNEGILTYTCPETWRGVATGISTDAATLEGLADFKISVWCPHCEGPHAIAGKQATVMHLGAAHLLRGDWASPAS